MSEGNLTGRNFRTIVPKQWLCKMLDVMSIEKNKGKKNHTDAIAIVLFEIK